jgi:hypothetical protein
MLSVEAAVSFYGEVDGVALLLLVILLVSRGVVLHLPERLEGHEDRFLLHRLLLRVWPVVRPVEGLVVLSLRRHRFLLPSHQIRGHRLLPQQLL